MEAVGGALHHLPQVFILVIPLLLTMWGWTGEAERRLRDLELETIRIQAALKRITNQTSNMQGQVSVLNGIVKAEYEEVEETDTEEEPDSTIPLEKFARTRK